VSFFCFSSFQITRAPAKIPATTAVVLFVFCFVKNFPFFDRDCGIKRDWERSKNPKNKIPPKK
jgi:hypothetical protein